MQMATTTAHQETKNAMTHLSGPNSNSVPSSHHGGSNSGSISHGQVNSNGNGILDHGTTTFANPSTAAATETISLPERVANASNYLKGRIPQGFEPAVGIVCGSGLGGLVDLIQEKIEIDYHEIPNFATSTVAGHAGKLVFGQLQGKNAVCMVGRFHGYEGWNMHQITLPIRVMASLGIHTLIVTNAAGGLNPSFKAGDMMVMEDHIGVPTLTGTNPLMGPNHSPYGPRFLAVSDAYDPTLRKLAFTKAYELGIFDRMQSGVYAYVSGPMYETKAESRMLRQMGGDAVGMSTVPEVIVARHMGVKVLGMSLVTNLVVSKRDQNLKDLVADSFLSSSIEIHSDVSPSSPEKKKVRIGNGESNGTHMALNGDHKETIVSHEEVIEASNKYAANMKKLVQSIIGSL